jgi:hypothetical protein
MITRNLSEQQIMHQPFSFLPQSPSLQSHPQPPQQQQQNQPTQQQPLQTNGTDNNDNKLDNHSPSIVSILPF